MRRPLHSSRNTPGPWRRLGRHLPWSRGVICTVVVWALLVYSGGTALPAEPLLVSEGMEPLVPLPLTLDLAPAKVALGERLFHDVRLSRDNVQSCATCHQLAKGGHDGLSRARLADGTSHRYNTPSVFNVALNFRYMWTGAERTLEAMIERVVHSPLVMHTTWPDILAKLRADPSYVAAFDAAYQQGLSPTTIRDALITYLRSLVTPNARFDRYLRGEQAALTPAERQGYHLFKAYGCVACHQGVNIGGNVFQKFGVFATPEIDAVTANRDDVGRFAVTKNERDRSVFRVPSLRNVALTAPYFHDGRALTLESAVGTMARVQLGRMLTPEEIRLIVQFLRTLTGEYRGTPLAEHAEVRP